MTHRPHLEIAEQIHCQADAVLQRLQLPSLIDRLGKLYFTGSYALNLMTWNDIDMQIVVKKELTPSEALMQIMDLFVHQKSLIKAQIINFNNDYKPHWPKGMCFSAKIDFPDLGGIWKFDIWSLQEDDFRKNRLLLEQLQNALTESTRELILEIKHELMQKQGRVPKMGSHWLYQAILLQGLSEKRAILDFLHAKGVTTDN